MGIQQDHLQGDKQVFYADIETAFGTARPIVGANAIRMMSTDFDYQRPLKVRDDAQASRGQDDTIREMSIRNGAGEAYLVPSGVAGTAPDMDVILQSILPNRTVSAGVSVSYAPNSDQQVPSLTLHRGFNWGRPIYMQALAGFVTSTLKFAFAGGQNPKVDFTGRGTLFQETGSGETANADTATAVDLVQPVSETMNVGDLVTIGTDLATSHQVVSQNTTRIVLSAAHTFVVGEAVRPYLPAPILAGVPIPFDAGFFRVDTTDWPIKQLDISIAANPVYVEDTVFTDGMSDAIMGPLTITGTGVIRARMDMLTQAILRKNYGDRAISARAGDTPGSQFDFTLPEVVFQPGKINTPNNVEADIPFTFMAKDTSLGADDRILVVAS